MNRIAIALTATALLTVGFASPAVAAPVPDKPGVIITVPGSPILTPVYYADPIVSLPNCKTIGTSWAMRNSVSRFTSLGDLSNLATHTGYGTELATGHDVIEDGGHSCTWRITGTKKFLTISVTPISAYDRDVLEGLYLSQFGSTGSSIGGDNMVFHGYTGMVHEVGFLLEDGVWVTGKVTDNGDYFPAVLQDVSEMVYNLNH